MEEIKLSDITQSLSQLTPIKQVPLTPYVVDSMLTQRSRYPVYNLMVYLDACGHHLLMHDMMLEEYRAYTLEDVHKVILELMDKYKVKLSVMSETTGVNYTPPSRGTSLSITTLIAVLNYMKCELKIVENNV